MKLPNPWKLIIAIIVAELAGAIGSIFTVSAIPTWYATLTKPALNPPNWVFMPVWNVLFILMGIAAFLVWKQGLEKKGVRVALIVFLAQLVLNSLWSFIFFGLHNPGGALVEIIFLWLAILATIIAFFKVSPKAAYLLVPYILWVTFAGYLNFAIWRLSVKSTPPSINGIACSMEARVCPDGSTVGRSGPNCEFAPCPRIQVNTPPGWLSYTDPVDGLSFNYPAKLSTAYTSVVNWPPAISASSNPFSCEETDQASSGPIRTTRRLVDNRVYCLKAISEGAAGSVFTDYTYTTQKDSHLITVNFILRAVQCYNYDAPQKTDCTKERETFDLDSVIDKIVQSVNLNK